MLNLQPIARDEAFAFIERHHRHHPPPQGWLFGIAINNGSEVVGVVSVGRPVARLLQDGYTAEVTRCCVIEGIPNGCSKLYGAAWRAARALGYQRLITYTLAEEPGISLYGAGWKIVGQTKTGGGSWSRPSRPRVDKHPLGQKTLWEAPTAARRR